MDDIIVLAKLKFDLRDPDEAHFARHELSAILGKDVETVRTIPTLLKSHPFDKLDERAIRIMTRHLYMGEVQGYMARISSLNASDLVFRPAFFREIYLIVETSMGEEQIREILSLDNENLYQIFTTYSEGGRRILFIRLLPIHTLFEYITDVKKLPDVAMAPKRARDWGEYLSQKERGIDEGLDQLLHHIRNNHFRAPHLGLGKRHIGDFVDWASTDLRKPFLHYIHKYKGKGDPRISRALINLLRVEKGNTILDPFAGSGAFLADAPTMGIDAIGVELLEIGRLISQVKVDLNYDLERLKEEILLFLSGINHGGWDLFSTHLNDELNRIKVQLQKHTQENRYYTNILPHLQKIVYLKDRIERVKEEKVRRLLLAILSQKIVEFSEKRRQNDFIASFLSYLEDRYLTLYATLKLAQRLNVNISEAKVQIVNGDSTRMDFIENDSIDGILTSPPYFDALDYVGNNRISIIILGFNRDLKYGSTREYFSQFEGYNMALPKSSRELINLLESSRRLAKARIVENYLKMMKLSFRETYRVLKPGRLYAMVISKYHTWTIDGREHRIETSKIIAELGLSEGFELKEIIQHGLSKADKGKINVEDILIFQK